MSTDRRTFIKSAAVGGIAISVPIIGCKSGGSEMPANPAGEVSATPSFDPPPISKPAEWDPIAYNQARGNAGFIPETYWPSINGPEGAAKHLGKHLPYVPKLDASKLVAGLLPIMWGDPALGHAMHPNAAKSDENPEGHWYNWIRIAIDGDEASQVETTFDNWPTPSEASSGQIVAFEGDDPSADSGKNSVYLAKLPEGVSAGTMIRIWAHCLTHGEYVDFLEVPELA